jgi:CSLREA domain-containing protein
MKNKSLILLILTLFWLSIAFGTANTARAGATITVNTTNDELDNDGNCSLREALRAVNLRQAVDACPAGIGSDTIILPVGTYMLTILGTGEDAALTGDLDILSDVTINGTGASSTIIDGNGDVTKDRVFHVISATVTISGMTIRNGKPSGASDSGGGIYNAGGTLTLLDSVVVNNIATEIPISGFGGGISVDNFGRLVVANSIISGNTAAYGGGISSWFSPVTVTNSIISNNTVNIFGGGIYNHDGALVISDSTLNRNSAIQYGGGIWTLIANYGSFSMTNTTISSNHANDLGGGIYNAGSAGLNNVTITNNTVNGGGPNGGGGMGLAPTSSGGVPIYLKMKNSIVAGNQDLSGNGPDCLGVLFSENHNLIQNTTGCTITGTMTNDLIGWNPLLGTLASNGGTTPTHALLPGSPAIDAGDDATCAATDQRGITRPQATRCDLGAFEYVGAIHRLSFPLYSKLH